MKTNINLLLEQLKNLKEQNNKIKSIPNQNSVINSLYNMLTMPKSEVKATKNDDDINELDFSNRDLLSDGFDKYNIHSYGTNTHKGWCTDKTKHVSQNIVNNMINNDITELQNQ